MATSGLGLLASAYGDDDEDEGGLGEAAAPTAIVVNPAPAVMDARPDGHAGGMWNAIKEDKGKQSRAVYQNPTYDEMWAPEQGPSASSSQPRSTLVGRVQPYHPSSNFAFEEQYHTFNAFGFAADPSTVGAQQSHEAGPSLATRLGCSYAFRMRKVQP